jgi:hypothetical protein
MTRKLFVTASVLVLTLPILAGADQRANSSRGSQERVAALAREVSAIAHSIYQEFARNNRRPNRDEKVVLDRLEELSDRAERFQDGDGDYRRNARYDRRYDSRIDSRDFRALVDSFSRTTRSLRSIARRSYVDQGMDRIEDRLQDLSRYYNVSLNRGWNDPYDPRDDRYNPRDDRFDRPYDRRFEDDRRP